MMKWSRAPGLRRKQAACAPISAIRPMRLRGRCVAITPREASPSHQSWSSSSSVRSQFSHACALSRVSSSAARLGTSMTMVAVVGSASPISRSIVVVARLSLKYIPPLAGSIGLPLRSRRSSTLAYLLTWRMIM
jgi:hypothetical protein